MSMDKAMLNAFDPSKIEGLDANEKKMIERRCKVLGPSYRLFYERPVQFVRGKGVRLYDKAGNEYLDAYNNVASVGHAHPRVVAAIAEQAATLNTHTRYLHDGILNYADRLLATFPAELSQVMFTCTGSEANDLALRVARRHTGGSGIIVTKLAYHGVTASVSAVSPSLGAAVPLGIDVRTVLAPDAYREPNDDLATTLAERVQAGVDDLKRHGIKPAALLVDTIFSSDGVFSHPIGMLSKAVEVIRKAGGVFIADEVQAGFGRTGSAMWGFQRHSVVPDIVTMGKPMGNGHPIAAMVAKPEVIKVFGEEARYFNTFGGNPVSCAAAMATLDVLQTEGLLENAERAGECLRAGFRELAQQYDIIGDVRGDGLFIGVELVKDRTTKASAREETTWFVNAMREERVLISATGLHGNVLKIRPPLAFTPADADILLDAAARVLARR
ncbi:MULTISPECIES: aspartate aminotransferase family protein [unclassified Burkholderia]|uniref:aspartate aminotransferase family protein n=1 Tax=unclassified Burkholderia TaxID=2613784 RepID=UPI000F55E7D2|nr:MULTISPECIES: aspartate aminotransferase family protein [unclassified Burkholderia]RQR68750.1 aspartate aminotransferase family protein [Burkholderia sp. Bp9012]RQR70069.1 aspartate aminotransferase family protein [Burkholderia sp. Bp9011]RQR82983.1 aspartate aminotransferase family protein [Burkholderia sp. Bp9010]RQZ39413.1 aspartate aminotransferase family protein [Burkholderia sp. Bp9099]